MNTDRWLTWEPTFYEDGFVTKEEHREFIQAVQEEALAFGLEYRIDAPKRPLEMIDRLTAENRRKGGAEPVATIWAAQFQVHYGSWRTIATETEPMTPQAAWRIDPKEWFAIRDEAARDLSR